VADAHTEAETVEADAAGAKSVEADAAGAKAVEAKTVRAKADADAEATADAEPAADAEDASVSEAAATGGGAGPRRLPPADRGWDEPHPSRLPLDTPGYAEILAAHRAAVDADAAGYLDPKTGLFVLTAIFLARRGTCCGRGCRHCPYA
jgi:hypothetical protein